MNNVILLGRLVKDPEVKYTNTGKVVAMFTLAVERPYAGADGKHECDFIPCVLWGKSAEAVGNYVHKGQRLLVEGRLQIRAYESNGSKRWVTEVILNRFEFVERKEKEGNSALASSPMESFGESAPFDESIPF